MGRRTREIQRLMVDVEDLLETLADDARAEISAGREKVIKSLAATKKSMDAATKYAVAAVSNAAAATDDLVHDHPWHSIGVVAGVSAAVGFLVGRITAPPK